MAKYRMVNTRFWNDNFVADELHALDRLLFLYLLTNDKTNIIGVYEIPIRTIAYETGIDKDHIAKMLQRLEPKIHYKNGWAYIPKFVQHQQKNKFVVRGMIAEFEALPAKIRAWISSHKDYSLSDAINTLSIDYAQRPSNINLNPNLNLNSNLNFNSKYLNTLGDESPETKKAGKKNAAKAKTKKDSPIAKLYYEAIKALDVPVTNHTVLQLKIREMERLKDQESLMKYLKFMRDDFSGVNWEYKPQIHDALQIYTKRAKIRETMRGHMQGTGSGMEVIR